MLFFFCLGGGAGPTQTANKATRPRPNSKKKSTRPLRAFFCFAVWEGGRVYCFCCLGGVLFFFPVWAGGRLFLLLGQGAWLFLLFGRVRVVFLLFGRVAFFFFFFCCLGGGRVFFAVWVGDGSSLTYRSAWLVFKRPNNKKDQTARKTRVPPYLVPLRPPLRLPQNP